MNITKDQAGRAREIFEEMAGLLEEFKGIANEVMRPDEYERFKYNTLGHIEPAVQSETQWYTRYSSINPIEKVVEEMEDEADCCLCVDDDDEGDD